MKVVIPGGTGQVGTMLARAFHAAGHDVVILSRRPAPSPWRVVEWDGIGAGSWRSSTQVKEGVDHRDARGRVSYLFAGNAVLVKQP